MEHYTFDKTTNAGFCLRILIRLPPLMSPILIPCVFLFLSFNIGETSQQPSEQEGTPDQSTERETSEDMLCLVAEIKKMIEEWEEMKLQLQHVLSTKDRGII